jgi:hypothetical protein
MRGSKFFYSRRRNPLARVGGKTKETNLNENKPVTPQSAALMQEAEDKRNRRAQRNLDLLVCEGKYE